MTEEESMRQMDKAYEEYARIADKLKPYGPEKIPARCDHCQALIWEGYTDDEDTIVLCHSCWEDFGK